LEKVLDGFPSIITAGGYGSLLSQGRLLMGWREFRELGQWPTWQTKLK
jgi:hypothetical protein